MNTHRLFCSAALGAFAAAFAAGAAQAQIQTTAPDTGSRVEEVVVTAQRRSENLQSTPVAVTALTNSALQSRQLNRVENLQSSVPSLTIQQVTASPSALTVNLRGAAELTGGLVTSESPVALYIDDVYQSRLSAANIDLGDIDRIEVLRGPQGTLYGRNSMTGAIKFITRQPTGAKWLDAEAATGSWDEKRGQISAGAPLGSHLGLAIAGLIDDKGGWQYDTVLKRHVGDRTNMGLRGSLGLVDTGPLTAVLRLGYVHAYGEGQYFTPFNPNTNQPALPSFGATQTPVPSSAHNAQTSGSLTVGYKLGDVTLRSISALERTSDYWTLDFSGGFVPGPGFAPDAGFLRNNGAQQHQFSQEFQATGDALGGRLHYIGGLFYFRERAAETIADTFGFGVFGPFPVTLLPTHFNTTSRSYAAYGQADYKITPKLTFTVGLRYSDDKKSFNGTIQSNLVSFPATYSAVATGQSSSVVTPKFTVEYQATTAIMSYITISRGYRAGGFNGLAVADPTVLGKPYAPETVWSYEAGAKADFLTTARG